MFTGIVEELGRVEKIVKKDKGVQLHIKAKRVLEDTKLGDSICTNGVCLTVVDLSGSHFAADVMHETLRISTLGTLRTNESVNLERAMLAGGRFGGHIVSGHIDGVGTIKSIEDNGISKLFTVSMPESVAKYTVMKGSITIDGISLTVSGLERDEFQVSIIPHTLSNTVLSLKSPGDKVNLEADIIGKYVERLMGFKSDEAQKKSNLTANFLAENGFL
ncbi:riboflavin synthase alpha chain [Peptoclostridium acidaminophilum DSM 3953]|uniref:Riboflavin synthase n=1 Tax=Peptoclostridium acidaminophilum DSM 3953 TaxID=1286171 RepID=W8T7T6_PEPAC|nr:riboflavin synthase [Peptoclostridium acidaminophilum]AHM56965.1 riboflavin synthase alpha chain [Peptoclostridium acidaminophilum DSM 3953]